MRLAGAVRLPAEGPGFQTIHLSRSSFWGAPSTIARIGSLGEQVRAAGLGDLYIEDISRPRGGPLPGGHLSHQLGLDADVGLDVTPKRTLTAAERETVELPSMVRADRRGIDPARWTADEVRLVRLAASLPEVDRILINPAPHAGKTYEFTGKAVTFPELAQAFSEVLGKPVNYIPVTLEQNEQAVKSRGLPDWLVTHMGLVAKGSADGGFAKENTQVIRNIVGRDPIGIKKFVEDFKSLFS